MTLHHLRVANLGVIGDASIELVPGFNVVTGETGAGKTLLLGGLRLLVGEKADSGAVGPVGDEARAEGLFVDGEEEIAVTRIVPSEGRSRAHSNGVLVSANVLAEQGAGLVEIVGQHDQIGLKRPAEVLGLIDGGKSMNTVRDEYGTAWHSYQTALADQALLGGDEMSLRRELDLLVFQANEILGAGVEPGEDHALEMEASRLRNVEELESQLAEAVNLLEQMTEQGGEVVARLRKASDFDPSVEAGEGLMDTLTALSRSTRNYVEGLERDPERLEYIESRLTTLGDLKRKYGQTVEEIIRFGEEVTARSEEIEGLLVRSSAIGDEVEAAKGVVMASAAKLTAARARAARALAEAARSHLCDLGMEDPLLEIRLERIEPGGNGADRAEIWFASDSRLSPAPLSLGASGGELSRLILAIRLAAQSGETGTLVFDEVDAGVGGVTALAMGRKLADLAREHQVLCVTHLPQVAAFADAHFLVEREGPTATARKLEGEVRVREISRMLAGLPESVAGNQAALELLEIAQKPR